MKRWEVFETGNYLTRVLVEYRDVGIMFSMTLGKRGREKFRLVRGYKCSERLSWSIHQILK